jgi:hypothetical protein
MGMAGGQIDCVNKTAFAPKATVFDARQQFFAPPYA